MPGRQPTPAHPGASARAAAARATAGSRRRGLVAFAALAAGAPMISLPLLLGSALGALGGGLLALVFSLTLLHLEWQRSVRIHAELIEAFAELEPLLDAGRLCALATRTGQRLGWGAARESGGLSVRRALLGELAVLRASGGCWSGHSPWCGHRTQISLEQLLGWAAMPAPAVHRNVNGPAAASA